MYAKDLIQVQKTFRNNREIQSRMEDLIRYSVFHDPILRTSRKNTEDFRGILLELAKGDITDIENASLKVKDRFLNGSDRDLLSEIELEPDWYRRMTNLHFSRFYNQAVLSLLIMQGQKECYIHHSLNEDLISICELEMAGKRFNVLELYKNLLYKYEYGEDIEGPIIPRHDLCTHVVSPVTY